MFSWGSSLSIIVALVIACAYANECEYSAPARLESQKVNRSLGLYSSIYYGINNNTYHLLDAATARKIIADIVASLNPAKLKDEVMT